MKKIIFKSSISMKRSPFLLQLLFIFVCSDHYAGRYFDPKNLTCKFRILISLIRFLDAECIPKQRVYAYYGAKNEALNGRKCVKWETVHSELAQQMQGYYQ